jgi:hypothetical protein
VSKKAILDTHDGAGRYSVYHEANGKNYIETRQKVDHIVKAAEILAEQPPGKDFRHVGFIPDTVLNQWMIDGTFNDPERIRRWLNDPENRAFRTWQGRV